MSKSPSEPTNPVVKQLTENLRNKLAKEAQELIQKEENLQHVKDGSWDIVRIVSEYLVRDTYIRSRKLFESCEVILEEVAKVAVAEEALLEFLEQAESLNNDMKFLAMLKPLQIVLFRLTKRKERSLGWCLNTVKSHLKALPVPEYQNLEGKERLLMDADPCVQRISDLYSRISPFYMPFVQEVVGVNQGSECAESQCHILICFLLHLLEKPLVNLDLEVNEEGIKSSPRMSAEDIVEGLNGLLGDLLVFLDYSGPPAEPSNQFPDEDGDNDSGPGSWSGAGEGFNNLDCFVKEDGVPSLSMAVLYYLVFAEGVFVEAVPAVYDPMYTFRCCLHHASVLLRTAETMVVRKGLLLCEAVLSKFQEEKLAARELDNPVYSEFVQVLAYAMVYCGVEECRKLAGKIFKQFLFKFDNKGRYLLVCNLQKTVNHSGTLGYTITLFKDMIHRALSLQELPPCFSGKCLRDLISGFCRLPHGAESDLMELADEVISALNLLRYLLLHDREDRTGVRAYMDVLEAGYLAPLREALRLSRAHYKLKLRDLASEQERSGGRGVGAGTGQRSEVTITVGCQQLPDVPHDQKVFLVNSALNAFDLMECLLGHVAECTQREM